MLMVFLKILQSFFYNQYFFLEVKKTMSEIPEIKNQNIAEKSIQNTDHVENSLENFGLTESQQSQLNIVGNALENRNNGTEIAFNVNYRNPTDVLSYVNSVSGEVRKERINQIVLNYFRDGTIRVPDGNYQPFIDDLGNMSDNSKLLLILQACKFPGLRFNAGVNTHPAGADHYGCLDIGAIGDFIPDNIRNNNTETPDFSLSNRLINNSTNRTDPTDTYRNHTVNNSQELSIQRSSTEVDHFDYLASFLAYSINTNLVKKIGITSEVWNLNYTRSDGAIINISSLLNRVKAKIQQNYGKSMELNLTRNSNQIIGARIGGIEIIHDGSSSGGRIPRNHVHFECV
jgi:hypothetical protein